MIDPQFNLVQQDSIDTSFLWVHTLKHNFLKPFYLAHISLASEKALKLENICFIILLSFTSSSCLRFLIRFLCSYRILLFLFYLVHSNFTNSERQAVENLSILALSEQSGIFINLFMQFLSYVGSIYC